MSKLKISQEVIEEKINSTRIERKKRRDKQRVLANERFSIEKLSEMPVITFS